PLLLSLALFLSMLRPAPRSTLFPYTTLFRSKVKGGVEGYGFGKGYTHVYDTFLHLLAELDRHVREGRNVIGIAHECTANVPNPRDRKSTRLNSSHVKISYAVFCLKKKKIKHE